MTPIELARDFVHSRVQQPALESQLPEKIKNKVRHSDVWLNRFKRVGDLLTYLKRFDVSKGDPIYSEFKSRAIIGL
jgi:5-methylcytosine-specific restriction protein A